GRRATGTLTSPNVIVPDQKGRADGAAPSKSSSGTLSLLLAGPRGREALLQNVGERLLLPLRAPPRKLDDLAGGFGLGELHNSIAVLVAEGGNVQLVLHRGYQLHGHLHLSLGEVPPGGWLEIGRRDHLARLPQGDEHQIVALRRKSTG